MNPDYGYSIAPELGIDPPEWVSSAVCASMPPEIFYPEKGESSKDAKRVCRDCPVRTECLQYALDNNERFGVWGGLSQRDRARLRPGYRGAAA